MFTSTRNQIYASDTSRNPLQSYLVFHLILDLLLKMSFWVNFYSSYYIILSYLVKNSIERNVNRRGEKRIGTGQEKLPSFSALMWLRAYNHDFGWWPVQLYTVCLEYSGYALFYACLVTCKSAKKWYLKLMCISWPCPFNTINWHDTTHNSPIQDYVHPDDQTQQLDQDKFSCLQQVNSSNSQDKFQIITVM